MYLNAKVKNIVYPITILQSVCVDHLKYLLLYCKLIIKN